MKKLKGIILQNFQSHRATRVRFAPLITTFVGESSHGKTSILRGIKLVTKNEPKGSDFISAKANKASVTLILEDGTEVCREKSKSVNRYSITYPNGETQEYDNFGNEIPNDVLKVLQSTPVKIDTDFSIDLNFAEQLEAPFLLGENDANKAKIIDGLAKINIFNVALRNVNSKISSLNSEEKNMERQLKEIEGLLAQYEDFEEMEVKLQKLQQIMTTMKELQQRKEQLVRYYQLYSQLKSNIEHEKSTILQLQHVRQADLIIQNLQLLFQKYVVLVNIKTNIEQIQNSKNECGMVLTKKDNILQSEDIYHKLVSLYETKTNLENMKEQFTQIQNLLKSNRELVTRLKGISDSEMLVNRLLQLNERKQQLSVISIRWNENQQSLTKGRTFIARLKPIMVVDEMVQKLFMLLNKQEQLVKFNHDLMNTRQNIANGRKFRAEKLQELEKYKEEYTQTLLNLNQCPVCFSKLDENHVQHIKASL